MGDGPNIPTKAAAAAALFTLGAAADVFGASGLGTTVATTAVGWLGGAAAGAGGGALWEAIRDQDAAIRERLKDPRSHLDNHDLQILAGRAIAVVLEVAATDDDCPGGKRGRAYLRRAAKGFRRTWDKAEVDDRYEEVLDPDLHRFLGRADGTETPGTALTADLWEQLVGALAGIEVDDDQQAAIGFAAEMLHKKFPSALYEMAKADAADDGKAFAAIQLRLMRDTMAAIGTLLGRQNEAIKQNGEILGKQDETIEQNKEILEKLDTINNFIKQLATDGVGTNPTAIEQMFRSRIDELWAQNTELIANRLAEVLQILNEMALRVKTAAEQSTIAAERIGRVEQKLDGRVRPPVPPSNIHTPSHTFVPRKNITKKIHAALQKNPEQTVIRQVVARALGGYGKTVAAILYAHEYAEHYPGGRFILPMESGGLTTGLAALAGQLGLRSTNNPAEDAAAVSRLLRIDKPSLLILDNITDKAAWDSMLSARIAGSAEPLLPRGACRVLVTTRDDSISPNDAIQIGRLNKKEAREIFRRFCADRADRAGGAGGADESGGSSVARGASADPLPTEPIADQITEWLGGLAVAVAAVAAFMNLNPDITWQEYWEGDGGSLRGLRDTPVGELPDALDEVRAQTGIGGEALEEHRRALHVIDAAINSLPAPERRAVEYAALLPHDLAPAQWLVTLLESDAERPEMNEDGTPDPLHLTLTPSPYSKLSPAEQALRHLSRLDILLPAGEEGRLLSLHRLWHGRVNERMTPQANHSFRLWNSIEIWIFTWLDDAIHGAEHEIEWPQAIALKDLAIGFDHLGRTVAKAKIRSIVRRVYPTLNPPPLTIASQASAVAKFIGKATT